jgi:hypothetical protein
MMGIMVIYVLPGVLVAAVVCTALALSIVTIAEKVVTRRRG